MRPTTLAVAAATLLLTAPIGFAQTLEEESDALLSLGRAGALVTFGRDGSTRVTLSGIENAERLLDHVKSLSKVTSLDLAGTDISDKGLDKITGLKGLQSLNLASSKVGDDGLKRLKGLTKLTQLSLYGTQVSDKGVEHLKPLKMLKTVIFNKTKVTVAGATELMESLPKVAIQGIEEWRAGFIRVEMEGKLLREVIDKKESWFIQVKTVLGGDLSWLVEFPSKEMQETAQRLEKKRVTLTGEIVHALHFPGIGGESFLIPPPAPKIFARTLRAAD